MCLLGYSKKLPSVIFWANEDLNIRVFSLIGFIFYGFYKSSSKMLPYLEVNPGTSNFHMLDATAWANSPICSEVSTLRSFVVMRCWVQKNSKSKNETVPTVCTCLTLSILETGITIKFRLLEQFHDWSVYLEPPVLPSGPYNHCEVMTRSGSSWANVHDAQCLTINFHLGTHCCVTSLPRKRSRSILDGRKGSKWKRPANMER